VCCVCCVCCVCAVCVLCVLCVCCVCAVCVLCVCCVCCVCTPTAVPKELWEGGDLPADAKAALRAQRRTEAAKRAPAQVVVLSSFGRVQAAGSGVQLYHGAIEHVGSFEEPLLHVSEVTEKAYVDAMASLRLKEQAARKAALLPPTAAEP
jgi:hypothetical protein